MSQADTTSARAVTRQWLKMAMAQGEKDPYHSKRQADRYRWNQPMELRVSENVLYVSSRDISEAGIGLVCKRRLDLGQLVHVRCHESDPWVAARVVHITQTVGAFKIGAELEFEF